MGDSLAAEAVRLESAYSKRQRKQHWSSLGHVFGHQERERNALALLEGHGFMPLTEKVILDVGCGSGGWIQSLIRWGARPDQITGIDLRTDPLARARERVPAAVRLEQANAAALPYATASFDFVLQATMFTSVLDKELRRTIASEMLRVLKPDGLILWYDFSMNNPKNPDVSGVKKREILALFAGCLLELRRITLAPPVLRWLAGRSWFLTYVASQIRPLCTHYMGAITKRA